MIGRLSAHLPPHVLKMFARATFLGKIRTYIHLSLKCRLSTKEPVTDGGKKLKDTVNDVGRILVRKRRSDHVTVEDLLKKAGLESVNAMVCYNSAMLALRASKPQSPLYSNFQEILPKGSTKSKAAGELMVPAPNTKNLALWNMARAWYAISALRAAKSVGKAKKAVQKFVETLPI